MIDGPLESHRRWSISNSLIKLHDSFGFCLHRWFMLARGTLLRIRRWQILRHTPRSILVVRLGSLGDIVRSTSLLRVLRETYPESDIQYLTSTAGQRILAGHPALSEVHALEDADQLPQFDWIINLQRPDPEATFLHSTYSNYTQALSLISGRSKFITGRHLSNGRSVRAHTTNFYCHSELEEFFLLALQPYRDEYVERAMISPHAPDDTAKRFGILPTRRHIGIFVGADSRGGHDGGFRTYSVDYIESLIDAVYDTFGDQYRVLLYGLSSVKSDAERQQIASLRDRYPEVINLVDRTNVNELICVLRVLDLVLSCDSGPLHMAIAVGTPVVALFANAADFHLGPPTHDGRVIALNGFQPCNKLNWRWKFFCGACADRHYEMYGCNLRSLSRLGDLVPVERVMSESRKLLARSQATGTS